MNKRLGLIWTLFVGLLFSFSVSTASAAIVPMEHEFTAGWHFISFPANPSAITPAGLFKDKDGKAISISGNLHGWDTASQQKITYNSANPDLFFNNTIGHLQGYWLRLDSPTTLLFNVYKNIEPTKIGLSAGMNMVSYPYEAAQSAANLEIKNKSTGVTKSILEARNAGWVSSTLYTWDSDHQGLTTVSGLNDDYASLNNLEPWQGYWLVSYVNNLELIIPVP